MTRTRIAGAIVVIVGLLGIGATVGCQIATREGEIRLQDGGTMTLRVDGEHNATLTVGQSVTITGGQLLVDRPNQFLLNGPVHITFQRKE